MSNILFIVGLPGSGKTTLAHKINDDNGNKYRIVDDPKSFKTDILPYLEEDLIINDPQLCISRSREHSKEIILRNNPNVKMDWLFFENNPEQCIENSKERNNHSLSPKMVENFIKYYTKIYTIPKDANIISVYKSNI